MVCAIGLYLAVNAEDLGAHGWGVAMSTDTAFALGLLALLGRQAPERLRGFILTLTVVDDIVGLVVIATVYTHHLTVGPLILAIALMAIAALAASMRIRYGLLYFALAAASWVALVESGIDPVVVGLAAGLIAYAGPPARTDLERTSDLFRDFREQPTAGMARQLRAGVRTAVSPNDRLQQLWHPWTSYLVVPLFGLANAGIPIRPGFLAQAYLAHHAGDHHRPPRGRQAGQGHDRVQPRQQGNKGPPRPPVGWPGGLQAAAPWPGWVSPSRSWSHRSPSPASSCGSAARRSLTAAVVAALLTWLVFQITRRLPSALRTRALLGQSPAIVDLADPVDDSRDHIRGPADADVTLVEYGDFECPYCGQAEPVIGELLADFGDLRYVWRHLPLNDVHQSAPTHGKPGGRSGLARRSFRAMRDHRCCFQAATCRPTGPDPKAPKGSISMCGRYTEDLESRGGWPGVAGDIESADLSGVAGTPSFFVNGQRQMGGYDLATLSRAVRTARAQADVGLWE